MTFSFWPISLTALSLSPVIVKWSETQPELLGFWRLLLAGSLVLGFQLIRSRKINSFSYSNWSLIAGVFFFLHLWTYMIAAHNTSIAHMVIIYATNPIYAILGGKLFFKEKIPSRIYWAYPIAFLSILMLMAERLNLGFSLFGNIMALVTAVFHAGYFLASKKARQTQDNLNFSTVLYLTSGGGFFLISIFYGSSLLEMNAKSIAAAGLLILFPTFLGHFLMTYLMSHISIAKLSFSKLIEPGLSTLAAYIVLGEKVSPLSFVTFFLTLFSVGIALSTKKENPEKKL